MLKDSAGKIVAGIEVIRDVTERKHMETEREVLVRRLRKAFAKIKTLNELIPVCAWEEREPYIRRSHGCRFTHGICPECLKNVSGELYEDLIEEM